jgi:hypothetical protein
VGGRTLGTNTIPVRAWIDDNETLWALLKTTDDVRTFGTLHESAAALSPQVATWMAANPMKVLALAESWPSILATLRWIDEQASPEMYLRKVMYPESTPSSSNAIGVYSPPCSTSNWIPHGSERTGRAQISRAGTAFGRSPNRSVSASWTVRTSQALPS